MNTKYPAASAAILPPATLGVLGGGQLGRMFTIAAKTMGYKVWVWDPDQDAPAAVFADRHIYAPFDDPAALSTIAQGCVAVTTEFENVNANAMRMLANTIRVAPSGDCVALAQDRVCEKDCFRRAGLDTVPYLVISAKQDLSKDLTAYLPGILKTARLGYDGKGQVWVNTMDDVHAAWHAVGQVPCVLEAMQTLEREISVIVARTSSAQIEVFPVAENVHCKGILDLSIVPARVPADILRQAQEQACQLANTLDYIGVLTVEFFILPHGRLLANEMAPRPHNSGHYTLAACLTDQFQQQVRTLCGAPPGKTNLLIPAVMVNVLGDCWKENGAMPNWNILQETPNAQLYLYGKQIARPGRKMGHFTVMGADVEALLEQARLLQETLL